MAKKRKAIAPDRPLPDRAEAVALRLAQGQTGARIAREVGVSEMTICRYKRKPAFRARVAELRRQAVDQALGTLTMVSGPAAKVLGQLLLSKDERIRLRAAKEALSALPDISEFANLDERLKRIEERLDEYSMDQSSPGRRRAKGR